MAATLADGIFNSNFAYENVWFPIKISLKCVPEGLNDNKPTLVQVMVWRRTGDKHIIWINADRIQWRMHASLGLNELICDDPVP